MSDMHDFGQFILERHAALGGITEVRILHQTASGRKAVKNGYFTPAELPLLLTLLAPVPGGPRSRLPHHAHPRSGEANIYFSLQAVKPEIAASRIGSISSAQHTTQDQDVLAYTLFVVDIDPVRPSGVSATDEEKEASRLVLDDVTCWFQERGINGIEADSGNGYHLLIPLIPITGDAIPKAADDAHTLLKLLDEQFSTPQAKVDTSTFNPSRILKFYGTKAVKGEHSEERPHRYASINLEEIPEDIALFSLLKSELSAFRSRKKSTRRGTMSLVSCTTHASSTQSFGAGDDSHKSLSFRDWKNLVLQKLPLETIYGPLLQTARSRSGWIVCRDPRSPTGDQNPSAGVADAVVGIERGTFHSFSRGDSMSVFHFMTMQAQTQSLVESYVKVGELVGIPYQSDRSSADALTEEFSRTWPELPDDNSRYSLIESTLAEAVKLSPLQRAKVMSQLKLLTGLSARTLQEVEYQVKQESRQNPQERKLSGAVMRNRVVVDYCSNADPVSLLFDNLVRAMELRHVLFRCEDGMCAIRRGKGPISVTERNLPGILSANVELRFMRLESGREEFSRYGVLPPELARSFLYDEEVLSQLPLLKLYTRSPLFAHRWQFIGTPGYHSDGYYYDGPVFTVKPVAEPGIPFHLREGLPSPCAGPAFTISY